MYIGCGPYKRFLDNFRQSESAYTFNVKFSKTAQNSAMSNVNSTKMLYIIWGGGNGEQFARNIGIGCGASK